jgi:hypothetical protein
MKRIIELGVVIGSLFAGGLAPFGCASDADGANVDDLSGAATATTTDALTAPQISFSGASQVTLLASAATGSTGVRITGDPSDGAFALVRYSVAVGGNRATAQLTVDPAPGASFIYDLEGSGSGYQTRRIRLERLPGSNQLEASTPTGEIACGPIADAATPVTLAYDGDQQTFDVRIGGAPSACTAVPTRMKAPAVGFELMDAANAGYGGEVTFSQLALF